MKARQAAVLAAVGVLLCGCANSRHRASGVIVLAPSGIASAVSSSAPSSGEPVSSAAASPNASVFVTPSPTPAPSVLALQFTATPSGSRRTTATATVTAHTTPTTTATVKAPVPPGPTTTVRGPTAPGPTVILPGPTITAPGPTVTASPALLPAPTVYGAAFEPDQSGPTDAYIIFFWSDDGVDFDTSEFAINGGAWSDPVMSHSTETEVPYGMTSTLSVRVFNDDDQVSAVGSTTITTPPSTWSDPPATSPAA